MTGEVAVSKKRHSKPLETDPASEVQQQCSCCKRSYMHDSILVRMAYVACAPRTSFSLERGSPEASATFSEPLGTSAACVGNRKEPHSRGGPCYRGVTLCLRTDGSNLLSLTVLTI